MISRILYYIFYCAAVSPISTMNYFFAKFSKNVLAKNLTEPPNHVNVIMMKKPEENLKPLNSTEEMLHDFAKFE